MGLLEIVGAAVGEDVGTCPHSIADRQVIQISPIVDITAPVFALLDLNPLSQVHTG